MRAADVLARAGALFLDFDGPVCSVFAGIPASTVADQLRGVLADGGYTDLPEAVATSDDPFDVFCYAATLGEDEARYVEATFTAHEIEAISSATLTEGAHELIHVWHDSGRPIAIVSNNSTTAINTYLDLYDLRALIDYVSARNSPDAGLLKPSPYLLYRGAAELGVTPDKCAFIGDSITDIDAARAAGVQSIGFANKRGKRAKFAAAEVDAITDEITGLATHLIETRRTDLR
ncbi:HAD family hydrolase [Amycolatopsis sp. NPDC058278]|uniref:HAD family hydrolase n=1 Tax=Amycolatopsis sp. NPDC058278 TaxID=3346417 RepID=UPI0036DC8004